MTAPRPIDITRKDGMLVPKQRWLFDRLFEEGRDYTIEIYEPQSTKSRGHYFATVREAWKTLPENISKQHPDSEHLRKWALIKTGWSIKRNVVCETVEMAHQIAAIAGQLDESAVIVVQGSVVTIAIARTQKTTGPGAMDREEFQKSKQDVLEYIAGLLGVGVATLSSQVPDSRDGNPANFSDRADTTPAGRPPVPSPPQSAGVFSFKSADWLDRYVECLTATRETPASLLTRHQDAIKRAIDAPLNDEQHNVMRSAVKLVKSRNEMALRKGEWDERLTELRRKAAETIKGQAA